MPPCVCGLTLAHWRVGGAPGQACRWAVLVHLWSCTDKLVLSPQLIEQRLGLLQIGGVKALGEPAVDRRQELQASARLPCCCHNRAGSVRPVAPMIGLLVAGHGEGLLEAGFRLPA